jgi:GNAT superfamily N-acetyltransferase
MPGYRFCRTDDVPLLVEAYNACRGPEHDAGPALTLEGFKALVRELNLWASSCMLAIEGGAPIGVLLAAKRDHATLIHAVRVHPDHRRRGHGRHMLDSLSSKLAILGPSLLLAEIPSDRDDLIAFFAACGYRADAAYSDHALEAAPPAGPLAEMSVPVTVDDLREAGLLSSDASLSWERTAQTLSNRAAQLEGLALGAGERYEAWILSRRASGAREIAAMGCEDTDQARALLDILTDQFLRREPGRVTAPRVSAAEPGAGRLASWGFARTRDHVRVTARATPA